MVTAAFISRRALFFVAAAAAVVAIAGGCRAGGSRAGATAPLDVETVTDMPESERGGTAVVLLHGWGARGDDLVPLARRLLRPRSRFFVPAGLLAKGIGGRAWWHAGAPDGPGQAWEDAIPSGYVARPEVIAARQSVQQLLRDVRARYAPDVLVVAGFSQGAMLSLDVALAADPPVDRVGVLSGALLIDSLPALRAPRDKRPRVLVAHGRSDFRLPFHGAERASELLRERGYPVTFHPFDGAHEIPPDVALALSSLIFGG
jgi:phospholipase/carboxylesterase